MDESAGIERVFEAVRSNHLAELFTTLGSLSAGANAVNKLGRSLLAEAVVVRSMPILLVLLQKGGNANAAAEVDGPPLLHFAIDTGATGSGGIGVVELLIQHGADVLGVCSHGDSVLHRAAEAGPVSLYSSYMTRYLLGAGANVHATNHRGRTALHVAVTTIAKETVKILCQHGANPEQPDADGKTPLQRAADTWSGDEEHGYLLEEYRRLLKAEG